MSTIQWIALVYVAGIPITAFFNLYDMVYMTRPLVVLRNILLWPLFLPMLVLMWWDDRR